MKSDIGGVRISTRPMYAAQSMTHRVNTPELRSLQRQDRPPPLFPLLRRDLTRILMLGLDGRLNEHHARRLAEKPHMRVVVDFHLLHVADEVALGDDLVVAGDEVLCVGIWGGGGDGGRCGLLAAI